METEKYAKDLKIDLVRTFCQIKKELSDSKYDYPISKRQNTDIEYFFAFKIISKIKNAIYSDHVGLASPILYLTNETDDGFSKKILIKFIDNELETLKKFECHIFSEINHYVNGFEERFLKEVSTEINRKNNLS